VSTETVTGNPKEVTNLKWEQIALKRALRPSGRSSGLIKGDVSSIQKHDLVPGFSASGQDVWLKEAIFHEPGLVLSAVGARCGKVFEATGNWGVVANTVVLMPQKNFNPHYLWYLVNREDFWEKGGSAQPYVRVPETLQKKVFMPLYSEQQQIADFLDRETNRIDAIIDARIRMIELLSERRQAVITETVTGNSGPVDWVPIKYLASINKNSLPENTDPDFEFIYIDISQINGGYLSGDPERIHFVDAPSRARRLVSSGDTIVSTVRTYLRAVWTVDDNANDYVVSTGFAVLTPEKIAHGYFSWWMQSSVFIEETVARSTGVSYPAINASELGEFKMRVPSSDQQQQIADFLDRETNRIDAIIGKCRESVALLRERRQALVTAAVTGELEVAA
jgi:type I restriction enzyme S subunit